MPAKKPDNDNKVFDVAKPGKSTPAASGRPVIIGHKSMLKDPMVKDSEVNEMEGPKEKTIVIDPSDKPSGSPPLPASETSDDPASSPSSAKLNVKPISKDVSSGSSNSQAIKVTKTSSSNDKAGEVSVNLPKEDKDAKKPESISEPELKDADKEPQAEAEEPTEPLKQEDEQDVQDDSGEPNSKGSQSATVEAVASQAENQKKIKKDAQDIEARKAGAQKLADTQKYFVPIGKAKRKRHNQLSFLVLLLLLFMVGAYLYIDAGMVDIGFDLPVEFIKN